MMRDATRFQILDGTSLIQRVIIMIEREVRHG